MLCTLVFDKNLVHGITFSLIVVVPSKSEHKTYKHLVNIKGKSKVYSRSSQSKFTIKK